MVEFKTADELMAHYKALRGRLYAPSKPVMALPARVIAKAPEPPPEPAPEPVSDMPAMKVKRSVLEKLMESQKIQLPIAKPRPVETEQMILPRIKLEEISVLVCDHVQMPAATVWSNRRQKEMVHARFLIWALAREFCHQHSLPTIGRFCNRDHTTIMHGAAVGKTYLTIQFWLKRSAKY